MEKNISPAILIILDGFGLPDADPSLINAIAQASTPTFDKLFNEYPNSKIETSGEYVGLPDGQMGNSEIGHLTIGAGRTIYTELVRIQKSLDDHSFIQNEVFLNLINKINSSTSFLKGLFYAFGADTGNTFKSKKEGTLHLMGLLSDGGVHSHINHLKGILQLCKNNYPNINVCIHAFLDGRDTAPNSGIGFVEEIIKYTKELNYGKLSSIIGRYYAMDRDNRWDRIEKAYNLLTLGKGNTIKENEIQKTIQSFYDQNITDEFMEPIFINTGNTIKENDAILFYNFRADRARQLTQSFIDTNFNEFKRSIKCKKDYFLCITEYQKELNASVMFEPTELKNILGEVISNKGLKQLRLAETEKYAHVTFFFNGGTETPFKGEDRILVPSPKVATYDLQPEMSAYEIKDKLIQAIEDKKYELIIVNFANGDMVGHTGVVNAAIKAVEVLDKCIYEIVETVLKHNYNLLITADHGNCEQMLAEDHITPFTQHTTKAVPLILVGNSFHHKKNYLKNGKLSDLAPTLLKIMNLEIPKGENGMNGNILVQE